MRAKPVEFVEHLMAAPYADRETVVSVDGVDVAICFHTESGFLYRSSTI